MLNFNSLAANEIHFYRVQQPTGMAPEQNDDKTLTKRPFIFIAYVYNIPFV
jgi:hypothetical protein